MLAQADVIFGPNQLGSVAGIVILSTILVEIAKRTMGKCRFLKDVPTFIYVTAISILLTVVAREYFHTLSGNRLMLIWNAIYSALAASGFYTWLRQPQQTLGQAEQSRRQRLQRP